jgi:acyl-CoA thioesterase-1
MMVMASPPFSWLLDILFFAAFSLWLIAWEGTTIPSRGRRVCRITAAGALVILLILLAALELPYRARPILTGQRADHLVVIGDSVSAGIATDESRWPTLFQKITGIRTINLAQPAAQTADAMEQAKKLTSRDTLVLIEIGGNDIITGVPAAEFNRDLDALLAACSRPGRTVIMFELPLLPYRIEYGRSQRSLADKYHVQLIPKRFFIDAISGSDATVDGLHLSPQGARTMASLVQSLVSPLLTNP